jgi:predicted Rossmann fold nucleotide-binding protein DprA/Smf involved in DNA uptake
VLSALRRTAPTLGESARALESAGFWEESLALHQPALLARAEKLVMERRVLTAACPAYPAGWAKLSRGAAPALWLSGELPQEPGFGIVGSRRPPLSALRLAGEAASSAIGSGMAVISGGAPGCDWAAGSAAKESLIEILPCGIRERWGVASGCRLSARPPDEPFTSAAAMERNALVYAWGAQTLVCHARFKEGGAWVGATTALRRNLCRVLVWDDPASLAARSLLALGAETYRDGAPLV